MILDVIGGCLRLSRKRSAKFVYKGEDMYLRAKERGEEEEKTMEST